MRGRKPKPEKLLKLTGAFRPDKVRPCLSINAGDAQPPDSLPADALAVWREFAPTLTRHGLLTIADGPVFEIMARELARWRRLEKLVESTGGEIIVVAGVPKYNPALREANRARDAVLAAAVQFGMTPSARRNVTATGNTQGVVDDLLNELRSAEA